MKEIVQNDEASERLLLRIDEAASRLAISRSSAYAMVAKGELPSVILGSGRMRRVPLAALRRMIDERTADTGPL